jgi:polysaccharide pyruvyl transferase WcaK-like protein
VNITFFGNFGTPNWGNESALLAFTSRVRAQYPDAELRCVCTIPEVTKARLDMDSVPFTTNATPTWRPELPLARRLLAALFRIATEARQYTSAFIFLRDTDMLIVPGTGLVTDTAGLHVFGPYSLFKWVLMAKLRRAKVLLVSVGAGPIDTTAGRILVRAILALADYKSFRDNESIEYLRSVGIRPKQDALYPDLVFGLPVSRFLTTQTLPVTRRRLVGLGLMVYGRDYSGGSDNTYADYLEALATFAQWLIEEGYDIRLLLGDGDTEVIGDFRSVLRARLGGDSKERVIYEPFTSVEDLLHAIAATDVVVATRFHNVLLALTMNKPVMAISFHQKCDSLMRRVNLTTYCHDIHQLRAPRLIERFQTLERDRDDVRHAIAQGVDQARLAVEEQYERLFGTTSSGH